jgi:hypothetical protein
LDLPDEETAQRVNAFDWKKEFPEAMAAGGFDAVIGNPPYIRIQALQEWAPLEVEHYKRAYRAASKGNYDIYVVFVEKGLGLLNEHGRLGFILPHKFFNAQYGEPLRKLLSDGQHLSKVVHFGDQQVFEGATTYTCLLFLEKGGRKEFQFVRAHDLAAWRTSAAGVEGTIPVSDASGLAPWSFVVGSGTALFERLRSFPIRLKDISERIFQGIIPGADKVYAVELRSTDSNGALCYSRALEREVCLEPELLRPIVSGADVRRFVLVANKMRVIYPYTIMPGSTEAVLIPPDTLRRKYPNTFQYFRSTKDLLDVRDRGSAKGPQWYVYIRRQNIGLQPYAKIAVPRLVNRLHAAWDSEGKYCLDNVDVGGVTLSPNASLSAAYVLALLNSKLLNFYFVRNTVPFRGGFYSANKQYIEQLPIRTINFADPADAARHDRMVALVTQMLDLHQRLAAEGVPHAKAALQRRIEATDRQIDALVYELYGLTDAEIAVVEQEGAKGLEHEASK